MATTLARQAQRHAISIKRVLAKKLNSEVKRRKISKAALARELGTSRPAVDRVLDPNNTSITLRTLVSAAAKLGYRVNLTLDARIDQVEQIEAPRSARADMKRLGEVLDRLA